MSEPEEKEQKKRNPLFWGIILALFPAIAYLIGISFYQGFQAAFGVSNAELPASTQYIYLCAYHAIGDILLEIPIYFKELIINLSPCYLSAVFITIIGVIYALLWLKNKKKFPFCIKSKHFSKIEIIFSRLHWKNNNLTKSIGIVAIAIYFIITLFYIFIILLIFWFIFSLPSYSAGQERAEKLIKAFTEEGCHANSKTKWNTCHVVADSKGKTIHEGLILQMNDKEITMFKADGTYTFTRQKDWVIQRKLHKSP